MGLKTEKEESSPEDFTWSYTQEPHASRRKEILAKYPQIKKLFGPDHQLKWTVTMMVLVQIGACYIIKDVSWPILFVAAYCFGGVINHSMTLAIHEISHSLAFGYSMPLANKALAIFGNLIIGVPTAVTFKKYHLDHHRYQGDVDMDVDIPHRMEAQLFKTAIGKMIWMVLQPAFYALRPLFVQPKPVTINEVVNSTVQFTFDFLLIYFWGIKPFVYLFGGTLLAMGIHPVAGHFISEHYMFAEGYETYSYYGPLNAITFNVGYHNEHHDFPFIPGSRLPQVREIASEYYNDLPYHTSWVKVLYNFITDPKISLYSRVKRKELPRSLINQRDNDDRAE